MDLQLKSLLFILVNTEAQRQPQFCTSNFFLAAMATNIFFETTSFYVLVLTRLIRKSAIKNHDDQYINNK